MRSTCSLAPPCSGPDKPQRRRRRQIRIGLRTAHRAHGIGAAVLLVVGMQDEQNVESARDSTGLATYLGSTIFHSMFMKFSV